jgi:hypothetical protein
MFPWLGVKKMFLGGIFNVNLLGKYFFGVLIFLGIYLFFFGLVLIWIDLCMYKLNFSLLFVSLHDTACQLHVRLTHKTRRSVV